MKPLILQASAVIFDVDGTLVDTVDIHAETWRRAFAEFGFDFAFDKIRSQIGKGGDQLLPVFLGSEDREREGEKINAFRADLLKREYLPHVRGFPEVRELFEFLMDAGKRIALGSSAKADDLVVYKKVAGIDRLKTVDTTAEDAEKTKPHPDIFLAALDRLGIPPHEVMVVGDTPYDAEAAAKAGMRTAAVLCGGFSEGSLRGAGAVEIYRDPANLLDTLRRALG